MKKTTTKFLSLLSLSLALTSCGGSNNDDGSVNTLTNISTPTLASGCPTGFVTADDFCVMQYEAKNIGGVPTSQADLSPWTGTYPDEAKALCQSLGEYFDLISNEEWLKVAKQVESVDRNWTGGLVGSGCLFRGNNNQPEPWNPCGYGFGDGSIDFGSNRSERARFELPSGQSVYDLAGNVSEWVDWTKGGEMDRAPLDCAQVDTQFPDINCSLTAEQYSPSNANYTSAQGIGKFLGGQGGYATRGGANWGGDSVGVFALSLARGGGNNDGDNGFRCVYRAPNL